MKKKLSYPGQESNQTRGLDTISRTYEHSKAQSVPKWY